MFGFVTLWRLEKGWGWIYDYQGNKFFAHISAVKSGVAPEVGDNVRFDVNTTPRGPAAINIVVEKKVEVVGGAN